MRAVTFPEFIKSATALRDPLRNIIDKVNRNTPALFILKTGKMRGFPLLARGLIHKPFTQVN